MAEPPKGNRGTWTALYDGEEFACVHRHWVHGNFYIDPQKWDCNSKFLRLLNAIAKQGRVLITDDYVEEADWGIAFRRKGYVQIACVREFSWRDDGLLRLELKNLRDLAGSSSC